MARFGSVEAFVELTDDLGGYETSIGSGCGELEVQFVALIAWLVAITTEHECGFTGQQPVAAQAVCGPGGQAGYGCLYDVEVGSVFTEHAAVHDALADFMLTLQWQTAHAIE